MGLKEKMKGFSRRSQIAVLIGILLAIGAGTYFYLNKSGGDSNPPGGPGGEKRRGPNAGLNRTQPVKASAAKTGDLDVTISALGTVTASNTAIVKARVDGPLIKINFRDGQWVKAGDTLAEIDPRPFQIQVDQAQGQLLKDQALLSAAQVDLERYKGLLAKDSIAKQQVDSQAALVGQYRGMVETDKAQKANAQLNLEFTRIKASASGRLGLRQVDVGNMVHTSDANGIVVITQSQPIYVLFSIPSENMSNIIERMQKGESLTVEAWNRDSKILLAEGKLLSVDNQIDVTTGTVKLKAEFRNKDNQLFPNQFVNARLRVETRHNSVLLSSPAVLRNAKGTYVYVIKDEEQAVEARPVKIGPNNDDFTVIEKGLAAGEKVVLDGADKLRDGAKVDVLSTDGQSTAPKEEKINKTAENPDAPPQAKGDHPKPEGWQKKRATEAGGSGQ